MKRKRTIFIALLLLLALAGGAIWYLLTHTGDPEEEKDIYAVNRLREEFQSVTVENGKGGFSFRRDPDSPLGYTCDEVEGLPQLLSNYVALIDDVVSVKATYRYEGQDLSRYGLDDPEVKATVTLTDGTTYTVSVGDDAPTENYCYFSVSTDPGTVYVIRKSQFIYYRENAFYLVDRLLAPKSDSGYPGNTETDLADRLVFTNRDGATISLERYETNYEDGAGQRYRYHQLSPVEGQVTGQAVQDHLSRIMQFCASSAIAKHPTEEQLAAYGLHSPATVITIGYQDREAHIRIAPAPDGNWYAYKEGVDAVWLVADYMVTWLDIGPRTLLSEYLLAPRMDEVSRLEISCWEKNYVFEIDHEKASADGKELDPQLFARFYKLACGVNSVNGTGSVGMDSVVRIAFTLKDGTVQTLELLDLGNRNYSIRLDGEDVGLQIRGSYVETLEAACEAVIEGKEFSDLW